MLATVHCGKDRESACHIADLQSSGDDGAIGRLSNEVRRDYLRCALAGNCPDYLNALRTLAGNLLQNPSANGRFTEMGTRRSIGLCEQSQFLAEGFPSAREGPSFSREKWETETNSEREQFNKLNPASALGYLGGNVSNGGVAQFKHYVAGRAICCTEFNSHDGCERARELIDALNKGPARIWNGLKLAYAVELIAGRGHDRTTPRGASIERGEMDFSQRIREPVGQDAWQSANEIFNRVFAAYSATPSSTPLPTPTNSLARHPGHRF